MTLVRRRQKNIEFEAILSYIVEFQGSLGNVVWPYLKRIKYNLKKFEYVS